VLLSIGRLTILVLGLVSEVSHASEDHGHAMFIGCSNHFVVSDGAAGLNDTANTNACSVVHAIAEWENLSRKQWRLISPF